MPRWTKKDVKIMCGAISSFWLENRPLGDSTRELSSALSEVRQYLQARRAEVVCRGIASLGNIALDRLQKNSDFVEHLRSHPGVYGKSTAEMIERFDNLAREERKDVERARALIARIEAEGLPPEVIAFDPISTTQ